MLRGFVINHNRNNLLHLKYTSEISLFPTSGECFSPAVPKLFSPRIPDVIKGDLQNPNKYILVQTNLGNQRMYLWILGNPRHPNLRTFQGIRGIQIYKHLRVSDDFENCVFTLFFSISYASVTQIGSTRKLPIDEKRGGYSFIKREW